MRGRPPTPVKILKLRGTYRRDRHEGVPDPPAKAPPCPTWFGKSAPWGKMARQEYRRLSRALAAIGVLTEIDRDTLLAYCDAVARWRHWRAELDRRGWTQMTSTGYEAPRPEVAFLNRAMEDMRRFGASLGLSPSDRRRVAANPPSGRKDDAADFLFGGAVAK